MVLDEFCDDYNGPLRTKYHLTHPEMCLVADEVGNNSSQRGEVFIGGQKYQIIPIMESTNLVESIYLVNILILNFYLNRTRKQNVAIP